MGGTSSPAIAIGQRISEGSVSNIIAEMKRAHGRALLNFYRALGIAMSKSRLNVKQCADGYHAIMTLKSLGIHERDFEGFIGRLKKLYMDADLGPESLVKQLVDLHYFLERNQKMSGTASIPKNFKGSSLDLHFLFSHFGFMPTEIRWFLKDRFTAEDELSQMVRNESYLLVKFGPNLLINSLTPIIANGIKIAEIVLVVAGLTIPIPITLPAYLSIGVVGVSSLADPVDYQ